MVSISLCCRRTVIVRSYRQNYILFFILALIQRKVPTLTLENKNKKIKIF